MKNVEDIYPLSPVQESLLYHSLSAPHSRIGYERNITAFNGELDSAAFRRTWQQVVDRHPALRTAFLVEGVEEPLQIVRRQVTLEITEEDWRNLSEAQQQRRGAALLAADEARGFDLQQAPLMRLTLLRLADAGYQLVWSFHHLVLDAWCRSVLLEEVFTLYAAHRGGASATLPPVRPYSDYVSWLREQDMDAAAAYWRRQLQGRDSSRLMVAAPRREDPTEGPEQLHVECTFDLASSERLQDFARRQGLTVGTLVQAGWALLLQRYSGGRQVLFGVTVSGRPADLPGVEQMLGVFINNLPVSVDVDLRRSLADWLAALQRQLAEMRLYEHCSQAQILEWSQASGGGRLFDSLVLFQNYPVVDAASGLAEQSIEVGGQDFRLATSYPVTLWGAFGQLLSLAIYADGKHFDEVAVQRMLGHARQLLLSMVEDPEALLGELAMLSASECQQLTEWGVARPAPAADWPGEVEGGSLWPDPAGLLPPPAPWPVDPAGDAGLRILDQAGRLLPVGVAGELCVLGGGVLAPPGSRAAEQAQRFLPAAAAGAAGGRVWRSGELARWLDGGVLELLGAADPSLDSAAPRLGRVPLRLELAAALRRHPAVRQALAGWPDGTGQQPVAWLVTDPQPPLAALAAELERHLPAAFELPRVVFTEHLPRTAEGQPDWPALPAAEELSASLAKAQPRPSTPLEQLLAGLWGELLGRRRVEPEDNLFELGMHSLSATRFVSRVRDLLAVDLPLASLFEEPTVAGQARRLERVLSGADGPELPPIEAVPRAGDAPLSFAQERLWFMQQLEPDSSAYNIPRSLSLSGALNLAALEAAIAEIRRRHEALRTYFPAVEGQPVQRLRPATRVRLPVVDLGGLGVETAPAEAQRLGRREGLRPFDLQQGPLLRASLLRLGEQDSVVLFNLHHIVSDAWSTGVLVREVSVLYQAACSGLASPLPELPIQYLDVAHWQRRYLAGEVLERQREYWKRTLGGAPQSPRLPTDRPRAVRRSLAGEFHHGALGVELSEQLKNLGQRHGTTLFMTMLAGFKALLYRLTDEADVVVGTDVANRNRLEVESLIGFFVNNLVLRTDLEGNPPFAELLRRVRQQTLGAFAHQDLPFDELVRTLKPPREPGRTPLFQVLFVLQNAPRETLELPGVKMSSQNHFSQSKFELALFLWETPEGMVGVWNYSTELFDRATIERWAESYRALMTSVAADPQTRLSQLDIYGAEQRRTVEDKRRQRRSSRLAKLRGARSPAITVPAGEAAD